MSGVLHGVIASLKAAAAAATDSFFRYVSLLLNTSATNGAQNNTFLDSSTNNFTVTRNGDTTQGSFNPYMPSGYWSGFFDGTGDYLSVPRNNAFVPGANTDFTVEAWIYLTATPGVTGARIIGFGEYGSTSDWALYVDNTNKLSLYISATTTSYTATGTLSLNTWTHVAASRSGTGSNNLKVFINGVGASFTTNTTLVGTGLTNLTVGADVNGDEENFTGYISNLRFVTGTGVYTADFTPPTTPLTAITNTSLLCLQDNRFKDNSTNAFAITVNGDTRISKFAPFNPPASYSTASYGGSGFFDGTGDYLNLASDAAFALPAAFTFECWLWPVVFNQTALRGDTIYASTGTSGLTVGRTDSGTGNRWGVAESGVAWRLTTTTLPTNGMWNHMVVVRDGSNNMALFLNGTRVANATVTTSFAQSAITVGSDNNQAGSFINGYMSNMRLVKGTAVYDPTLTTLTVPTAPLTAITNTSLLLNFTNAGIYDAATINDGQTVGNAQVSTTQAKFGTTSMYFDGDDRLVFASRPEIAIGTGNFTIEGWIYRTDTGTRGTFQISGTAGGLQPSTSNTLGVGTAAGSVWEIYCNNTNYVSTATYSTNTWYHFALVRNSGTTRLYIGGTSVISQADTTNYTGQNLCVGAWYNTGFALLGYIQDLRITNGVARYTANFTPPTAAFPTL